MSDSKSEPEVNVAAAPCTAAGNVDRKVDTTVDVEDDANDDKSEDPPAALDKDDPKPLKVSSL